MENQISVTSQNQAGSETESLAENINLRHYWRVILERRWLVITAFISVFVLCLIYLFKATPIFQALTRLQINREADNVLNIKEALSLDMREVDYLQTQYKNLQSRTLIESVIKQLDLEKDPRYAKQPDKAKAVLDDITIAPIRLSRLVDAKVEHPNAKTAADMANKLAELFIKRNTDQKMAKLTDAYFYLKQEAESLATNVTKSDFDLHKYREDKKMISLEESQNIVLQALRQAQADLDKASSEAAATESLAKKVQQMLDSGMSLDTIPEVNQDPLIQAMKRDLAVRNGELANLRERYLDPHPNVQSVLKEIAAKGKAIQEQSLKVIESFKNAATLAETKKETLSAELGKKTKEAFELSRLRVDYDVLSREVDKNKRLFDLVLSRTKEMDLMGKDPSQNILIIDVAAVPVKPIKPRIVLTLVLGVLGGLAVAIGLAFFVNYLDDSIKSQDDVETYLRLAFLGYVPNIKTNSVLERDLQSHLHPQSNAAEGFRTIRAAITLAPKADRFRVLAVTSTIPSEGKSLVGSNLAVVTAQTGLKTLLVDADLRRPSVHKAFQLQSPIGLSSYLTEKVNRVDEFIHTTEVPNLDVVCCGAVPSSPSELVGSKRMVQFLQEVRTRYDRVILDCPPVSAVSDPLVIASMCDGVVFVTKFNKIRREHARKSIRRVQDAGIHILGVVLNDIDFEGRDSYYYSYYYYQNRYYASHYKSKSETKEAGKAKAEDMKKS